MKKKLLNKLEDKLIYDFLKKNIFYNKFVSNSLNILFKEKKINFANIYLVNFFDIETSVKNKNIDLFKLNNNAYMHISIYFKNKMIKFSTHDISYKEIYNILNKSIKLSRYISEDKYLEIPSYKLMVFDLKNLKLFNPIRLNINERFKIISFIENNILNKSNNDFTFIDNINFSSNYKSIIFGNTFNIIQSYNTSYHQIYCEIISKKNEFINQKYDYINSRSKKLLNYINNFGLDCSKESFAGLNPIKIKSKTTNVIIRKDICVNLFHDFYKSIIGKNVYLKSTYLLNYMNKQIFPSWMNIIENPHIPEGLGSCPFDKEGIKTYKKFIIKNGVLKNWLLDTYSSSKLKLKNTGNFNGIYNWIFKINHKEISFENLIKEMNNGILITDLLGNGLNVNTGDYSQGISGFLIKNSEIIYPISEITISGNMINIFKNIIYMSNDYEKRSNINCGSILINDMIISGI